MQGSYNSKGLPRPYYMKPVSKNSIYSNKATKSFINSPRRKLIGYVIMLVLFGTCVYWISQDIRPKPEPQYEIVEPETRKAPGVNEMINRENVEKDSKYENLAYNMAKGSKGDVGRGVDEAPKGGMANEAPLVGNEKVAQDRKPAKVAAAKEKQGVLENLI
ncbi:Piso0_000553 [Millerozyma farinosa CBS 7064]|uniref:Piso0_000553 protein n=1 Tax=Pichia sorbitophila (strain ATCC MYA-4447 / BCRC 22081 / CBS 7064 / NBRC 10061 / NRRL Y-12695) TaxID=559304 RepID=G8YVR3_PICSO|nr:Piso0_000553 [Millerozyma farinosa CBS 7064]CCE73507.1 Piso0_000553 [Millerozyma farinosa CBS 7064]